MCTRGTNRKENGRTGSSLPPAVNAMNSNNIIVHHGVRRGNASARDIRALLRAAGNLPARREGRPQVDQAARPGVASGLGGRVRTG